MNRSRGGDPDAGAAAALRGEDVTLRLAGRRPRPGVPADVVAALERRALERALDGARHGVARPRRASGRCSRRCPSPAARHRRASEDAGDGRAFLRQLERIAAAAGTGDIPRAGHRTARRRGGRRAGLGAGEVAGRRAAGVVDRALDLGAVDLADHDDVDRLALVVDRERQSGTGIAGLDTVTPPTVRQARERALELSTVFADDDRRRVCALRRGERQVPGARRGPGWRELAPTPRSRTRRATRRRAPEGGCV